MTIIKVLHNLIFSLHIGNGVEQEVYKSILDLANLVYGEKGVYIITAKIRCTQGKYYFKDSIEARDCVVTISESSIEN